MRKSALNDKRICVICKATTTWIDKYGYASWRRYQDGYICSKCHDKRRIRNPEVVRRYNAKANLINNKRRLCYKGKMLLLKFNPRTYVCSWCGKFGATDMHHIEYHDDNPLKDTIELCDSCHSKETKRRLFNATGKMSNP